MFMEYYRENYSFKLFISFSAAVAVLTVFYAFMAGNTGRDALTEALLRQGTAAADVFSHNLAMEGIFSEDSCYIEYLAKKIMKREKVVGASVFNEEMEVLFSSEEHGTDRVPENIESLMKGLRESESSIEYADGKIIVWKPILDGSNVTLRDDLNNEPKIMSGAVRVMLDGREIANAGSSKIREFAIGGLVFWLVVTGFSFFLSRRMAMPAERIAENMRKFGETGEFDEPETPRSGDLGSLASSFSAMARNLRGKLLACRDELKNHMVVFENAPDASVVFKVGGQIVRANSKAAKMLGYDSVEQMTGEENTWYGHMAFPGREGFREYMARADRCGTVPPRKFTLAHKDKSIQVPAEVTISPVHREKGEPEMFVLNAREASACMEMEKEKKLKWERMGDEKVKSAVSALLANAVHEINNPANYVTLNTPLVMEIWEGVTPILNRRMDRIGDYQVTKGFMYSEVREILPKICSFIMEGGLRIGQIVSDLRRFSDDSAPLANFRNVDVNEAISSAIAFTDHLIKDSTKNFTFSSTELPPVYGNFRLIDQLAANLIKNACQALPDREKGIFVSTYHDRICNKVVILVHDEGVGIPPEDLPSVFDPFFSTKRGNGGTGLGLSVCNRIVENHGGKIEIESTLGEGTRVKVMFPLDICSRAWD